MLKRNIQLKKGFTLAEVMVAVSIFAVVTTVGLGALLTLTDTYRATQVEKEAMDTLGFVLESMSREIRAGSDYGCGKSSGELFACYLKGGNSVHFDAFGAGRGEYSYYLDNGVIYRNADGDIQPLTSLDTLNVTELRFRTLSVAEARAWNRQPIVVMNVVGKLIASEEDFEIQSAVSERPLEKPSFF